MRTLMITLFALLCLLFAQPATAQGTGETGPFTLGQIYLPDPLLPAEAGHNPAMLDLAIRYNPELHVVFDYGQLGLRSGFTSRWSLLSLVDKVDDKSAVRVTGYWFGSNCQPYANTAPLAARFAGEGIEIAYARQVSPQLTLGLAWVPYNAIRTTHYQNGRQIATGTLKSDFQGRLGALWQQNGWQIGLTYDHESLDSADLRQRMATVGVAYRLKSGTTLYTSRLWFWLDGQDLNIETQSQNYGLRQELGKGWIVGIDQIGKGTSLSLVKLFKRGSAYLSVGERSFSHTEGIFGERGQFVGIGGSLSF